MTVTAEIPLVNVANSTMGSSIDNRRVDNLPLVSRDSYTLLNLTAGIQSVASKLHRCSRRARDYQWEYRQPGWAGDILSRRRREYDRRAQHRQRNSQPGRHRPILDPDQQLQRSTMAVPAQAWFRRSPSRGPTQYTGRSLSSIRRRTSIRTHGDRQRERQSIRTSSARPSAVQS